MTTILIVLICGVLLLVLGIAIFGVSLYNGLVKAKTRVEETWRQIDVRLQNRFDLLPDLIQAVEKATSTDKEIQTKIAEVRSASSAIQSIQSDPQHAQSIANADGQLTSALSGLRVAVEAYPELRSQEAIQNFMNQDSVIEEKIAGARQIYNATVREYNEKIGVVPSNIVANIFNFKAAEYFEAAQEARKDVGVDWGANVISR